MNHTRRTSALGLIATCAPMLALIGCGGSGGELTQMQADVTHAASELVVQDATARREIIRMQEALDEERRLLAQRERQDPIIAAAIQYIGALLLCLLPLMVIAKLFWRSESPAEVSALNELVVDELLVAHAIEPAPKRLPLYDLDALVRDRIADQRH